MISKHVRIIGIETSCDETGVAIIVTDGNKITIEKNFLYSQIEEHKKAGGVVPEQAARRHLEVLPHLIKKARINFSNVDYIAVTLGPGLVTSLMVGVDVAKTLSWRYGIPLIPVNHVYGHLLSAELPDTQRGGLLKKVSLPALGLAVSGGHTELVMFDKKWQATIIGRTRDDAAGEAFDKAGRLMGLSYPGGPEIDRLSKRGSSDAYALPRPMEKHHETHDYSFSGLKNALRLLMQEKNYTRKEIADIAASFQKAVVDSLIIKFEKGINDKKPKSIIMGGGVANNTLLRREVKTLAKRYKLPCFLAPKQYSGDNAVMIAWTGWHVRKNALPTKKLSNLSADPQLSYEKK